MGATPYQPLKKTGIIMKNISILMTMLVAILTSSFVHAVDLQPTNYVVEHVKIMGEVRDPLFEGYVLCIDGNKWLLKEQNKRFGGREILKQVFENENGVSVPAKCQ